jgi:hypothetical protein
VADQWVTAFASGVSEERRPSEVCAGCLAEALFCWLSLTHLSEQVGPARDCAALLRGVRRTSLDVQPRLLLSRTCSRGVAAA